MFLINFLLYLFRGPLVYQFSYSTLLMHSAVLESWPTKEKHACKSYFFAMGTFLELFTAMIWLNVEQERCYIGNGKIAE